MIDAPPPSSDPFEPMRRSYEEALDAWSATIQQMMGTDRFSQASNEMLSRYAEAQRSVRDSSRATADALHVPTKDDLAQVAELVVNVERKLDELVTREGSAADQLARLPVDALGTLPERLSAIDARLGALAAAMPPAAVDPTDEIRAVGVAVEALGARLEALGARLETLAASIPAPPVDPSGALAVVTESLVSLTARVDALGAAIPPPAADHSGALDRISERIAAVEASLDAVRTTAPPAPADPAEILRPVLARLDALEGKLDALAAAGPAERQVAAAPAAQTQDAPAPTLPTPRATPAKRPSRAKPAAAEPDSDAPKPAGARRPRTPKA